MPETNRILEQTSPPHFCLKVVSKIGGEFRKLTIVRRCIYIYILFDELKGNMVG